MSSRQPLRQCPPSEKIGVKIGERKFWVSRDAAAKFIKQNRETRKRVKRKPWDPIAIRRQLMNTALEKKANAVIDRMQSDALFARRVLEAINTLSAVRRKIEEFTQQYGRSPTARSERAELDLLTRQTVMALETIEKIEKEFQIGKP